MLSKNWVDVSWASIFLWMWFLNFSINCRRFSLTFSLPVQVWYFTDTGWWLLNFLSNQTGLYFIGFLVSYLGDSLVFWDSLYLDKNLALFISASSRVAPLFYFFYFINWIFSFSQKHDDHWVWEREGANSLLAFCLLAHILSSFYSFFLNFLHYFVNLFGSFCPFGAQVDFYIYRKEELLG